jgi:hypothetical protein
MLTKLNESLLDLGATLGEIILHLIPIVLVLAPAFALTYIVLGIFMGYGVGESWWIVALVSIIAVYAGFGIMVKIEVKRKEQHKG